jgi:hypothetical protein
MVGSVSRSMSAKRYNTSTPKFLYGSSLWRRACGTRRVERHGLLCCMSGIVMRSTWQAHDMGSAAASHQQRHLELHLHCLLAAEGEVGPVAALATSWDETHIGGGALAPRHRGCIASGCAHSALLVALLGVAGYSARYMHRFNMCAMRSLAVSWHCTSPRRLPGRHPLRCAGMPAKSGKVT